MENQTHHFDRPVAFPELHDFRDFFPKVSTEKIDGPLLTLPAWEVGSWSDRKGETVFEVGRYLQVRTPHLGLWVEELPPFIADYVREEMLHCSNDHTSFEVVVWNDGRALVIIQHGVIIGSRYLGIIDATTIPTP